MTSCALNVGTKVVIGAGQSAKCSDYLHYGTSSKQQVFIVHAEEAVSSCQHLMENLVG